MSIKRHIRFLLAAALSAAVSFAGMVGASARTVYNLNAGWTFFMGNDTNTDNAQTVFLPHTWNNDATVATAGSYFRGTGNYIKNIEIPSEWRGKRVFLRVGGAATVADVFVNARHTVTHKGAGTAFTVEITDRLRWGQGNNFRIVVDNSPRLDVFPLAGQKNVYGGLFRGVELIVCEPMSVSPAIEGGDGVRITTHRVSTEAVEGTVQLKLLDMPSVPAGSIARICFTDGENRIVAQNSAMLGGSFQYDSNTLSLPFTVNSPHLWQGVEDPYLYDVGITLIDSLGIQTDSLSIRTGFRTFGVDEQNNFLLNGRPLKLRGVVLHRDRMMVGTALTPFQIGEDIAFIREMGANAVMVAGGSHNDYFYTLCDEAGLIVWNGTHFTGSAYPTDIDFVDTPELRENGLRQLRETISQLYNHPSIAAWSLFSNVSLRGDDPLPYIRELNRMAHRLDRYRLTAGSSRRDGEVNFITDLILFELSFGWDQGLPDGVGMWIDQFKREWSHLRAGISFSAGASIFHQSEKLEKPTPESHLHPESWQTFFHEEYMRLAVDAAPVWGVFVGNMFDFGAARNIWGDGRGIDDRGLVTFDRKDRKDAFWIYKANWNTTDPFVHIAGGRLDVRTERRQTIRAYSNLPEVELFAGGRSLGKRTGERGIFVWDNINLRMGQNRLEARADGGVSDAITITVDMGVRSPVSGSGSGAGIGSSTTGLGSGAGTGIGPSGGASITTVPIAPVQPDPRKISDQPQTVPQ